MPGRLFLIRPIAEIAAWCAAEGEVPEQSPRRNIAPGEGIVVLTPERRLSLMRWGMIPVGRKNARGRPVLETIINARSETVFEKSAFEGVGRAIVPVDGWYEWTGQARRKTPWRVRSKDGAPLAFAAITDRWEAPGGKFVEQVAIVTCEPNEDVRPIHHRMGVLLDPEDFDTWLNGADAAAHALCRPYPEGRLFIEEATDVDFTAP